MCKRSGIVAVDSCVVGTNLIVFASACQNVHYTYLSDVECISETGAADNIFIFVCGKDRFVPWFSLLRALSESPRPCSTSSVVLCVKVRRTNSHCSRVCWSSACSCIPLVSAVVNMPLSEPEL